MYVCIEIRFDFKIGRFFCSFCFYLCFVYKYKKEFWCYFYLVCFFVDVRLENVLRYILYILVGIYCLVYRVDNFL